MKHPPSRPRIVLGKKTAPKIYRDDYKLLAVPKTIELVTEGVKMSKEFRLEKYLGVLGYKENYTIPLNETALKGYVTDELAKQLDPKTTVSHQRIQVEDITSQFPSDGKDCLGLYRAGDMTCNFTVPTLTKNRIINEPRPGNNILTYICKHRHWEGVVRQMKDKTYIPWHNKKNKAIWRGAQTNRFTPANPRLVLVKRFIHHEKIDAGFVNVNWMEVDNFSKKYIKGSRMSIAEMLTYKYIISLEGNDIATNLSWILYSNSLVIMPVPIRETWLLESCLIPWVHFVPISATLDDLEEKIEWCIANDDKCQQIVENASVYISNFLDFEEEAKLSTRVMEAYFNRMTFTCNNVLRQQYSHRVEGKRNVKFI